MTSDASYRREPGGHHPWQTATMPMRQDCKFFESRTYANGETVRKCDLDLAPEAPWRCPHDCAAYTKRLADVNWKHGTLITPPTPDEPPGLDDRGDEIAALLDEAEDIINSAGPRIMAEVDAERARSKPGVAGKIGRFFRRKPKG